MLGWTPSDVDRHTFRDIYYALGAARERRRQAHREAWERTGALFDAIYNWGGPRGEHFQGHPIGTTYRQMFDIEPPEMSTEQIMSTLRQLADGQHI